jgi:hypothetical protein
MVRILTSATAANFLITFRIALVSGTVLALRCTSPSHSVVNIPQQHQTDQTFYQ